MKIYTPRTTSMLLALLVTQCALLFSGSALAADPVTPPTVADYEAALDQICNVPDGTDWGGKSLSLQTVQADPDGNTAILIFQSEDAEVYLGDVQRVGVNPGMVSAPISMIDIDGQNAAAVALAGPEIVHLNVTAPGFNLSSIDLFAFSGEVSVVVDGKTFEYPLAGSDTIMLPDNTGADLLLSFFPSAMGPQQVMISDVTLVSVGQLCGNFDFCCRRRRRIGQCRPRVCTPSPCDLPLPPVCAPELKCGNNKIDPGEECDDGNRMNGDGCSALCTKETVYAFCGNGKKEGSEWCDDGNNADGDGCTHDCKDPCAGINNSVVIDCTAINDCGNAAPGKKYKYIAPTGEYCGEDPVCLPLHSCGNSCVEGLEQCDPVGGSGTGSPPGGALGVKADWTCVTGCKKEWGPYCGDGSKNGEEECDKSDEDCTALNVDGKVFECKACKCARKPICGDKIVDPPQEDCDGNVGVHPVSGVEVPCTSGCKWGPYCGDGEINAGEQCDDGVKNGPTNWCTADCKLNGGGSGLGVTTGLTTGGVTGTGTVTTGTGGTTATGTGTSGSGTSTGTGTTSGSGTTTGTGTASTVTSGSTSTGTTSTTGTTTGTGGTTSTTGGSATTTTTTSGTGTTSTTVTTGTGSTTASGGTTATGTSGTTATGGTTSTGTGSTSATGTSASGSTGTATTGTGSTTSTGSSSTTGGSGTSGTGGSTSTGTTSSTGGTTTGGDGCREDNNSEDQISMDAGMHRLGFVLRVLARRAIRVSRRHGDTLSRSEQSRLRLIRTSLLAQMVNRGWNLVWSMPGVMTICPKGETLCVREKVSTAEIETLLGAFGVVRKEVVRLLKRSLSSSASRSKLRRYDRNQLKNFNRIEGQIEKAMGEMSFPPC